MCGIAGAIDLAAKRSVPTGMLQRMADAIIHRGPDDDGYLDEPGVGLANRRLSIVGLFDGKQPISNEDGSVVVVFNGEFFDYPALKIQLEGKGHQFRTHCDTEVIPHLWEDHQEGMFEYLKGQFAFALWDRRRHCVILGRDRFGICPLFYSTVKCDGGDWLLFGSEIKAILASGWIKAAPDLRGIDQVFNFFAVPGPATCFAGVTAVQPGQYLRIQLPDGGQPARMEKKYYWQIDFPDRGHEDYAARPEALVDEFEKVMLGAVDRRLRADVPVVSYLSGGIDSSLVVAMAAKIRGTTIPTFTIQIMDPKLDERSQAAVVSKHIGSTPVIVQVGDAEVMQSYPELIRAAEAPVIDTSCTALLRLAHAVHEQGYKVALTGEGSDEWLGGYAWFKIHRLLGMLDVVPGLELSFAGCAAASCGFLRRAGRGNVISSPYRNRTATLGGHTAFQDLYGIMSMSRFRYYSPQTLEALSDYRPYLELEPNFERMKRWHPLNRAFLWAGRIHLAGHLLSLKGDRVAMNSSVETRYPFLDEEVFNFLARIPPRWKLHGFRDKYILRLLGERYLPREVAWRPKGMFRAPLDSFFDHQVPPYVEQLLSDESLRKTGYFNVEAVQFWRDKVRKRELGRLQKSQIELGLVGVVTTQLWHQLYIDDSLADLSAQPPDPPRGVNRNEFRPAMPCVCRMCVIFEGHPKRGAILMRKIAMMTAAFALMVGLNFVYAGGSAVDLGGLTSKTPEAWKAQEPRANCACIRPWCRKWKATRKTRSSLSSSSARPAAAPPTTTSPAGKGSSSPPKARRSTKPPRSKNTRSARAPTSSASTSPAPSSTRTRLSIPRRRKSARRISAASASSSTPTREPTSSR